jgi:hypothetical protein
MIGYLLAGREAREGTTGTWLRGVYTALLLAIAIDMAPKMLI